MRKGFTIVEMIAVLGVVSVILFSVSGLWLTVFYDIPQANEAIYEHSRLDRMLMQMKNDIDIAVDFPQSDDAQTLIIEQPAMTVSYEFGREKIVRYAIENSKTGGQFEDMTWKIPDAVIQWRLLESNNKIYAVAVQTHIQQKTRGSMQKKLANSHVFFVGVVPETQE